MTDMVLTLGQRAKSIVRDPFFWVGSKEMGGTALGIAAWGLVTGVARPIHIGRTTSTTEIVLTDEAGRRTCTAKLTCLHRDNRPST